MPFFTEQEIQILYKSAHEMDAGKSGKIPFSGGATEKDDTQEKTIRDLYLRGYVTLEQAWGMIWYRIVPSKVVSMLKFV